MRWMPIGPAVTRLETIDASTTARLHFAAPLIIAAPNCRLSAGAISSKMPFGLAHKTRPSNKSQKGVLLGVIFVDRPD
jgi:hypothetical protein